tara:strand:- start:72053 stop:74335 length:2283 start_codon:yes stop_codon:yes gene_type:complete
MKLMILESGAKARTVKKYLGKGWIVDACNGHIQDLPSNTNSKQDNKAMWASKPGELPKPPWGWTNKAEKLVMSMRKKAIDKKVEEIFIATDPDREGEFIAWRLKEIFHDFPIIYRVSFNEITNKAVKEAVSNPSDIDMDLVDAAKVRRFMDRLVGFRCSRFSRSWNLASMGRVQTPTLGFLVERELEREAHIPIPYHSLKIESNGVSFKVRFHEKDDDGAWADNDGKHHPDRTFDSELAEKAKNMIEKYGKLTINSVNEGKTNRKPKPPFTTETMLRTVNSRMGWSISRTNRVATSLYQSGHITYIRTDSTRTSQDARNRIRKIIEKQYGADHLGEGVLGPDVKNDSKNVQDAHEAIRPTQPDVRTISDLSKDEAALYGVIWARFASSQMSDSIRERRDLVAKVEGLDKEIYGTSSWRIHAGWEAVFSDGENVQLKPPAVGFKLGSDWKINLKENNPEMITDETKPPRRFTESSIIQEMKKSEIGRPSTYLTTIEKLQHRNYVEKEGSSLIPTTKGKSLWIDVVPFYGKEIDSNAGSFGLFTTDFTSKMEEGLDQVEDGEIPGADIWHKFVEEFRIMHNNALELRKKKPTLKQMKYLKGRLDRMEFELKQKYLKGKSYDELTGDDARSIIEGLNDEKMGPMPASDKQLKLIMKLAEKLNINLDDFLIDDGITDLDALTGGRDGSASEIIGKLIELDKASPATKKQVDAIVKMCEKSEIKIEDAIASVEAISIEEISKSEASELIDSLKKNIQSRRKAQNK